MTDLELERENWRKVDGALNQFAEGSISFIEFIRYCHSMVTKEMVDEFNRPRLLDNTLSQNEYDIIKADWPFRG